MDQTKALNTILESADLISMLEELTNASARGGITSIAGLRITLRNIREQLLASHDSLAPMILSKGRIDETAAQISRDSARHTDALLRAAVPNGTPGTTGDNHTQHQAVRRDLRATIEKVLENS